MKTVPIVALAGLLAPLAPSQVTPRALLVTGDPVPGSPGRIVSQIERIGPNHSVGLLANIATSDAQSGTDLRSELWGTLGGQSFTRLERSDPTGPLQLTGIVEIPGGDAVSTGFIAETASGDAVIAGGQVIAREGEATAPSGAEWTRFVGLRMDASGTPWYRGRYAGAISGVGFFRGLVPVFLSGDTISGMPGTVSPAAAPFPGYDVTSDGQHWLAVLRTNANVSQYVVKDGAVLAAGGVPLVSGATLPAPFQASPGETYNTFDLVEIAGNARWAVLGGTPFDFILRDGTMYRRGDDVVDGEELANEMRAIALDDAGNIAWVARVKQGGVPGPYAAFREDALLFKTGDGVDVDGDGAPDPGYTITDVFGDRGRLVHGEDGAVYSIVRLSTPGGLRTALVGAGVLTAVPFCSSEVNTSGERARIVTLGSTAVLDQDVRLACIDMPANTFALFLASRDAGFTANPGGSVGNLCLGGTIGRFNSLIQNSGSAGVAEIAIDLGAIPEGGVASPAVPGDTWRFQCWFRDVSGGAPSSNLSDGVALTFR